MSRRQLRQYREAMIAAEQAAREGRPDECRRLTVAALVVHRRMSILDRLRADRDIRG